jgi:hypothetical protein
MKAKDCFQQYYDAAAALHLSVPSRVSDAVSGKCEELPDLAAIYCRVLPSKLLF